MLIAESLANGAGVFERVLTMFLTGINLATKVKKLNLGCNKLSIYNPIPIPMTLWR